MPTDAASWVTYGGESGEERDAEVDPWAVVVRHGRWYLLGHSHRAGAIRTYRNDRILAVRQLPHSYTPPDDLDPVAVLEENLGAGWEHPTRVVCHASREQVAPWIWPPMGRLEPDSDRCILVGSTRNPTMYAQEWLVVVSFDFSVEEGPELRAAVATVAARFSTARCPVRPETRPGD